MYPHFPIIPFALSFLSLLPPTFGQANRQSFEESFQEAFFEVLDTIPDAREYGKFLKQNPQLLAPAAELARTNQVISFAPSNEATLALLAKPDSKVKRGAAAGAAGAGALMAVGPQGVSRRRRGLSGRQVGPPVDQITLETVLTDTTYVNLGPGEGMRIVSATNIDPKTGLPLTTISAGLGEGSNITSSVTRFRYGTIQSVSAWFTLPRIVSHTLTILNQRAFLNALISNNIVTELDSAPRTTIFVPIDSAILPGAELSSCTCNQHVLENTTAYTPDIVVGQAYKTKDGTTIIVTVKEGKYYVNDALITQANVITTNGVVHFVDRVISPIPGEKGVVRCET